MKKIFLVCFFIINITGKGQVVDSTFYTSQPFLFINEIGDGNCRLNYRYGILITREFYPTSLITTELKSGRFLYREYNNGTFSEYYENGKLKIRGKYAIDSVECIGCFDIYFKRQIKTASNWFKRIGKWSYYYENGIVASEGSYKGIHETYSYEFPKHYEGTFVAGGLSEEYLKDDLWNYYNILGNKIKEEYYFNGFLIEYKTYEY